MERKYTRGENMGYKSILSIIRGRIHKDKLQIKVGIYTEIG